MDCYDLQRIADLERDLTIALKEFASMERSKPVSIEFERLLWRRGLIDRLPEISGEEQAELQRQWEAAYTGPRAMGKIR